MSICVLNKPRWRRRVQWTAVLILACGGITLVCAPNCAYNILESGVAEWSHPALVDYLAHNRRGVRKALVDCDVFHNTSEWILVRACVACLDINDELR